MIKFNDFKVLVLKDIILCVDYFSRMFIGKKYYIIDYNVYLKYNYLIDLFLGRKNYLLVCRGEVSKNIFFVFYILNLLILECYDKNLYIICIGGGVVGDISGLVSSLFYRGVNLVHIPTTIISQVDSSIGGKNGVNTSFGKNLVGTIYHACYVMVAVEFLFSLTCVDFRYGFSEIVKIMIINNPTIYKYLLSYIKFNHVNILIKIIKLSIVSKMFILKKDIYDVFYRLKLNLGHTFAHAIESASNFKIMHGLAVFYGLYIIFIYSLCFYKLNMFDYLRVISLVKYYLGVDFFSIKSVCLNIINYLFNDKKSFIGVMRVLLVKKIGKVNVEFVSFLEIFNFIDFISLVN